MAATLSFTPVLSGLGAYTAVSALSQVADNLLIGQNGFNFTIPQLATGNAATYTLGQLQCNDWYSGTLTIAGTTTTSINLNTGSDKNPFGVALAWTFLKYVLIAVQNPDGIINVQVGPQAVANAAQLWFGGTGATVYDTVYFSMLNIGPKGGWTLTASTACLFPITNPGAAAITVAVFLAGGS